MVLSKSIIQWDWEEHSRLNLTDHAIVRALDRGSGSDCLRDLKGLKAYDVRFAHELNLDFENVVYVPELDLLGCRKGKKIITLIECKTELKLRRGKYEPPREDEVY
jgi:hypothetical protein